MFQAISPCSYTLPHCCYPQNCNISKAGLFAMSLFSLSIVGVGIGIQSNPAIVLGSLSFVLSGSGFAIVSKADAAELTGVVVDRNWDFVKKKGEGALPDEVWDKIFLNTVEQLETIDRINAIFNLGIVCKQWCRVTRNSQQQTALIFKDFYGLFFFDQHKKCYFTFPLDQQLNSEISKIFSFEDLFKIPTIKNLNLNSDEVQISLFQKSQSSLLKGQTEKGAWFFLMLCKALPSSLKEESSLLLTDDHILILWQEAPGKKDWFLTTFNPLLLPKFPLINIETKNSQVTEWIRRAIDNQSCGQLKYVSKGKKWVESQDYRVKLYEKMDLKRQLPSPD